MILLLEHGFHNGAHDFKLEGQNNWLPRLPRLPEDRRGRERFGWHNDTDFKR